MFEERCWNNNCKKDWEDKKEMCCWQKCEKKPMYADCQCKFDMKMPMKEYDMGCYQKKMW